MRRNKDDTNNTIRKLIEIARKHFTERGYTDTALEDIVQEAQLTRGALYYHFGSKKGLFQIVFESVQKEIARRVEQEASKSEDPWEQLRLGCRTFIMEAVAPKNMRILLIDGPSVLGWDVWRTFDEQNSMRLLHEQLQQMKLQGYVKPVSIQAMTHSLSGAMNELVLWIAHHPNDEQINHLFEESVEVIALLLNGFKNNFEL